MAVKIQNPLIIMFGEGGSGGSTGGGEVTASSNFGALVDRSITSVSAEDLEGIETIGTYAFSNCTNLKDFELAESVTKIEDYAFNKCRGLKEIDLTKIDYVGNSAFDYWTNAQTIILPTKTIVDTWHSNWRGTNCNAITETENSASYTDDNGYKYNIYKSGEYAELVEYNGSGTEIIVDKVLYLGIEYPVEFILQNAFKGKTAITKVTIGNGVINIGNSAFRDCTSLTSVSIGDNVTDIVTSAFNGCTSLTSVTFGENSKLTSLGNSAFSGCTGLTSIVIPNNVTTIGERAFKGCTGLESVAIGSSLTIIGNDAFSNCKKIDSVDYTGDINRWVQIQFGSTVTGDVEANPLYNGATLSINGELVTSVNIDISPVIKPNVFYGCTSITDVMIGDNVTEIGHPNGGGLSFYNCTNLKNVTIGNGVPYFRYGVFGKTSSLNRVTVGSGFKGVNSSAFDQSGMKSLVIYKYCETIDDVPTLANTNAATIPTWCITYVPDQDTLNLYKDKTNWKDISSRIKLISELEV